MDFSEKYITPQEWEQIDEDSRRAIADAVRRDRIAAGDIPEKVVTVGHPFYERVVKRALDLLIGGVAFLIALPVNLIIGVVTFFDVGSPIFFSQTRIGRNGKPFKLTKFRNMTNETNEQGVLLSPDERVTKWGRFVRRTSLDELLNLWSVIKGDMSILGPRPLVEKYYHRFSAYHQQRHLVRPGLECPFHDRSLASQGWKGRFDNDVWYVENISFMTDIRMAFLLVKKVFSKSEREESASGKTGEFIGYCDDGRIMNEFMIPRKYLSVVNSAHTDETAAAQPADT